jgi:hypothetical protein
LEHSEKAMDIVESKEESGDIASKTAANGIATYTGDKESDIIEEDTNSEVDEERFAEKEALLKLLLTVDSKLRQSENNIGDIENFFTVEDLEASEVVIDPFAPISTPAAITGSLYNAPTSKSKKAAKDKDLDEGHVRSLRAEIQALEEAIQNLKEGKKKNDPALIDRYI